MPFRLAILSFSSALFLGHLFRYFPGMRQGVLLAIAILLIAVFIAGAGGVMAMFMGRHYLTRTSVVMGVLPGLLVGLAVLGIVVVGGLI